MESCLKFLARKSYNTFGVVLLTSFVLIGVVVIGIAIDFETKATLHCNPTNPDKTIASDLSTRKFINRQCFLKYQNKFYFYMPLYCLFLINFGLVTLVSIIYAYWVKHRVEIFVDQPNTTINSSDEENQPLLGISGSGIGPYSSPKIWLLYCFLVIRYAFDFWPCNNIGSNWSIAS